MQITHSLDDGSVGGEGERGGGGSWCVALLPPPLKSIGLSGRGTCPSPGGGESAYGASAVSNAFAGGADSVFGAKEACINVSQPYMSCQEP